MISCANVFQLINKLQNIPCKKDRQLSVLEYLKLQLILNTSPFISSVDVSIIFHGESVYRFSFD
jgi:hypothetical protein